MFLSIVIPFLVAGTVHVMMSLETPTDEQETSVGVFIFVYSVGTPYAKNTRG